MDRNDDALMFLLILVGCMVGAFVGSLAAWDVATKAMQKKAVLVGAADYDPATGAWRWKEAPGGDR